MYAAAIFCAGNVNVEKSRVSVDAYKRKESRVTTRIVTSKYADSRLRGM